MKDVIGNHAGKYSAMYQCQWHEGKDRVRQKSQTPCQIRSDDKGNASEKISQVIFQLPQMLTIQPSQRHFLQILRLRMLL